MSTIELKCPDCGKICKTKASLKLHMKSHQDMHQKEEELTKVFATEKQNVLLEVLSQLEKLKIDTNNKIQEQIDRIQSLLSTK